MDIRTFFIKKPRLEVEEASISQTPMPRPGTSEDIVPTPNSNSRCEIQKNQIPSDIARLGEPIIQTYLHVYPKNESNRSFQSIWFKRYKWLQYSVQIDSAFCYPCQQFQPYGSKQATYTQSGFKNWKNALDPTSGFPKHEKTSVHIQAMVMWEEKVRRDTSSTAVSTLVNQNVLEIHRYYIKSIIEAVQFLVVNELALRGSYVIEEQSERGLFQKMFEYTIKKDPTLRAAISHIPQNAKYTSPEIQNEIIEIMAETVRENIVNEIQSSDVPWFTLLEDGTRDKNNRENIAIAIRYVKGGVIKESLLVVTTTNKLDAETFTEATLSVLKDNNIPFSRLLSQCYDGASVMSGKHAGVAAKIEKRLQRKIPYVHCYNHRLHLVVVRMASEITFIRRYFDQCATLHEFFQHGKITALYEGKTIGRLLEQRWTGHLSVTNVIYTNFKSILKTLEQIPREDFNGDDVAKSVGLRTVMLNLQFRFALTIMKKVLSLLQPADAALQGRATSLKDATAIVLIVKTEIENLRTDDQYKLILRQAVELSPSEASEGTSGNSTTTTSKRIRKPTRMDDFVLLDAIPSHFSCQSQQEELSPFKQEYFELLDLVTAELKRRFSENGNLIDSISTLEEFNTEKLGALKDLGKFCYSFLCNVSV